MKKSTLLEILSEIDDDVEIVFIDWILDFVEPEFHYDYIKYGLNRGKRVLEITIAGKGGLSLIQQENMGMDV